MAVEVATLKERVKQLAKSVDTLFRKHDEREARSNQQLFMTVLNLLGIIVTLAVVLWRG